MRYRYDAALGRVVEVAEPLARATYGPAIAVRAGCHFTSRSLPRHWPYAKNHAPGTG